MSCSEPCLTITHTYTHAHHKHIQFDSPSLCVCTSLFGPLPPNPSDLMLRPQPSNSPNPSIRSPSAHFSPTRLSAPQRQADTDAPIPRCARGNKSPWPCVTAMPENVRLSAFRGSFFLQIPPPLPPWWTVILQRTLMNVWKASVYFIERCALKCRCFDAAGHDTQSVILIFSQKWQSSSVPADTKWCVDVKWAFWFVPFKY